MYSKFFMIPKAVYYFCLFPALIIIIASIVFAIVYRKKKGTEHYAYTLNYIYTIVSMLLSLLLLPLLLGYSIAMIEIISRGIVEVVNNGVMIILFLLPLIPLISLIVVFTSYVKGVHFKSNEKHLIE